MRQREGWRGREGLLGGHCPWNHSLGLETEEVFWKLRNFLGACLECCLQGREADKAPAFLPAASFGALTLSSTML